MAHLAKREHEEGLCVARRWFQTEVFTVDPYAIKREFAPSKLLNIGYTLNTLINMIQGYVQRFHSLVPIVKSAVH
jgi:hypothetical protein